MADDLPRLVALVADDLAHRGYPAAGIVQRAARELALLERPSDDACPVCGGVVVQPATGRRRTYCCDRCKRRANRNRNRSMDP